MAPDTIPARSKAGLGTTAKTKIVHIPYFVIHFSIFSNFVLFLITTLPLLPAIYPVSSPIVAPKEETRPTNKGLNIPPPKNAVKITGTGNIIVAPQTAIIAIIFAIIGKFDNGVNADMIFNAGFTNNISF